MKARHNKKRNTAFLYEALIRELTKSIVSEQRARTNKIKKMLKKYFGENKTLKTVLECYEALSSESNLDKYTAEKIIFHAKKSYHEIGQEKIFEEQTKLIKEINSSLGSEVYDNFVPNYKSLATLAQIFGSKVPLKSRILMENKVIDSMMRGIQEIKTLDAPDNLVVKSFITSYNKKYSNLLPEQKKFLGAYINSVNDGAIDFRVYVSSELKRIKEAVQKSLELEDVKSDENMVETTKKVIKRISSMNVSEITERQVLNILKMQNLVNEYAKDDNKN